MGSILTPRERFALTLAHEQPDRPPIYLSATPEIYRLLEDHFERRFGTRDVREVLEVDFREVWPLWREAAGPPPWQSEDLHAAGFYQDTHGHPLAAIATMDDVAAFRPPNSPEGFDFSGVGDAARRLHEEGFVTIFGGPGLMDIVNGVGVRGRGYEQLLCEIMAEDEVAIALIDRSIEADYEYCRRGLEAGGGEIDILYIGEDCGTQKGPLFAPERFRSFFAPRMKRFADLAHGHGAACMLHSCGSTRDLMPIFIEEVGLDILDAVQPEPAGMEPEALKRDFGDRLTFLGMISLQQTLARGTPDECRREAEHRIRVIGRAGGYIFGPPNTITMDTPLENVLAIYEVATGKTLV